MKIFAMPALTLSSLLVLTACDSGTPDTPAAGGATATPAAPVATPATATDVPGASGPRPTTIPAAIQGRWGMVEADCEPGRDDAKGLLVITPTRLEFYESVGTLDEIEEGTDTRIRADFDFTGEGMTWDHEVTLDVQDGGRTLIRREHGDDAAPGPFRYSKCA